ncbi:MAG: hypothetical protein IIX64_05880 [Bacteroidales bacterium]|nr:hypothetical protein [Bacteroidales bacterium]
MADNYLEKRYEEVFGRKEAQKVSPKASLDNLLAKDIQELEFDAQYKIHPRQLDTLVSVNTRSASGAANGTLRFRLVWEEGELNLMRTVLSGSSDFAALSGQMAPSYILLCPASEHASVDMLQLGMCVQNMKLKALEMGLALRLYTSFSPSLLQQIQQFLQLPLCPCIVLGIGKPSHTNAEGLPVATLSDLKL